MRNCLRWIFTIEPEGCELKGWSPDNPIIAINDAVPNPKKVHGGTNSVNCIKGGEKHSTFPPPKSERSGCHLQLQLHFQSIHSFSGLLAMGPGEHRRRPPRSRPRWRRSLQSPERPLSVPLCVTRRRPAPPSPSHPRTAADSNSTRGGPSADEAETSHPGTGAVVGLKPSRCKRRPRERQKHPTEWREGLHVSCFLGCLPFISLHPEFMHFFRGSGFGHGSFLPVSRRRGREKTGGLHAIRSGRDGHGGRSNRQGWIRWIRG